MATVLEEEDLIAQAQKRERARLEEEARILAFQQQQQAALPPPVWAGSPEVVIDQFNAQPGAVGAPTLIGSDQYQNELARAARGSGYVAADVGPMGNMITPGYDPATDPRAIAAEQAATNYKRQQLYGSLLRDGATAAEAFRFANSRYPDIKSAPGLMRAEALAERNKPFVPQIRNVGGLPMVERSRGNFAFVQPAKTQGGKASEATKAAADNLADQIASLRKRLQPGPYGKLSTTPEEAARIQADITRKERERVALFETPEANPDIDQPSWNAMRPAWEAAGRPPAVMPQSATLASVTPVSETITVTTKEDFQKLPSGSIYVGKDGKRYRKP